MYNNDELFKDINEGLQVFLESPHEFKELAYEIQLLLLDRIIKVEVVITQNNEKIKLNKQKTKDKNTAPGERKEISLETKRLNGINEILKQDLKRLREIGDSIAFAYFNKHDLKSLCWKQTAGFIGGKDGLKRELEELEKLFKQGNFAILNDLTNSLRFGDITVEKDGKPHLVEIKASVHSNARIRRQEKDLKGRMEIIHNDYVENLLGSDIKLKKIILNTPEKNYVVELGDLIDIAMQKSKVVAKIEEGLTYIIIYKSDDYKFLKELIEQMDEPKVIYINSMKGLEENYIPFPNLISDSNALMEFYNGNLILMVVIEMGIVKSKLDYFGYKLSSYDEKGWTIKFDNNEMKETVIISNFYIARVGREFVSLEWIISGIHEVIKEAKKML